MPTAGDDALRALMFDRVREAAFAWELDGPPRIVLWNRAAERLYGYSFAEVVRRSPHTVLRTVFPISAAHTESSLRRDGRWSGELRHTTQDGSILIIDAQLEVVRLADGRTVVLESARDLTARRRDEQAALEASARLRLALSASNTGIWEWHIETDRVYWSPEAFVLLGANPETFRGTRGDFERIVHPDDREALWANVTRQLATGREFEHEFRVIRPDGAVRLFHNRATIERDAAGQPVRLVGTVRDLTDRKALTARMLDTEARFRTLADAMPQLAWSALPDGCPEWINQRLAAATGVTLADLQQRGWTAMLHPEDHAIFSMAWPDSPIGDDAREVECRIRAADDGYRWYLARAVPQRDERGEQVRWLCTATDIEDRKRLEDALRGRADELEALLDAVPAAVWITRDPDARQVVGSRVGHELLRSARGRNLSKTGDDPSAVSHFTVWKDGVELAPEELPLQRAARGEQIRDFSEEVRFGDGTVTHVYGSAVPVYGRDGAPSGAIAAFIDVTPLRNAEAALHEASRRKDEFLATLSHELRNPLAPILQAVDLLQQRGEPATRRMCEVIQRQATHLARLVDDLLDASRITRGKLTLSRALVELAVVIDKAAEAMRPMLERKRQVLTVDVPREGLGVEVDEVRFTQVISNVLANAARYTPDGGRVRISAAREGSEVTLRIADDGSGIEPELLPHVFEMFVQGRAVRGSTAGGLGIGLAMVQRLVELHGGRVSIRSAGSGQGTEVTIQVAAATMMPASPPMPVATPAPRSRRVLIVEDNVDAADLLGDLVESSGYAIKVVYDAEQALEVASVFEPGVAILGLGLPRMDGYELGSRLRERLASVRLIALTGVANIDRGRASAAGFDDQLAKPVSATRLLGLLEALG
jgi:PAS domain S-box-containing protein